MNTGYRNIIVNIIPNYINDIKKQFEIFYENQRYVCLKLEMFRNNWFLTDQEMRDAFKLEDIKKRVNTIINIKNLAKNPVNLDLTYITLMHIISKILLYKFNKSEHSLYKFIEKIKNNKLKIEKQKNQKIIKRIIDNNIKYKLSIYNNSKINIDNINNIIIKIKELQYTTEKCDIYKKELINILQNTINNKQKIKYDYKKYVNYLPDNLYNLLIKLII